MRASSHLLGAVRKPITSKQGNKNYFKGNGSGKLFNLDCYGLLYEAVEGIAMGELFREF
jgi:hypothetical protein